jgi:hypothetical protein
MKTGVKKAKKKPRKLKNIKADADEFFNRWIRNRDQEDGFFRCVSCHETKPITEMNAGHYIAKKNCLYLRYNEFNVNGECAGCNCFDPNHQIGYRQTLLQKYGEEKVLELERDMHKECKMMAVDYLDIIEKYK